MKSAFKNVSFKSKMIVSINLIVMLVLGVTTYASRLDVQKQIQEVLMKRAGEEATQIAKQAELILEFNKENLQTFIDEITKENSHIAYAVVIDENVTAIAHSDEEKIGRTYDDDYTVNAVKGSEQSTSRFYADVQKTWANDICTPIYVNGEKYGILDVGIYENELSSTVSNVVKKQLMYNAIAIIGICILVVTICTRLFSYIKKITYVCDQIGEGNLQVALEDKLVARKDEIGKIANGIEVLRGQIKEMVTTIGDEVVKIEGVADDLTSRASETVQSGNEIAMVMLEINKGSAEQKVITDQFETISEEISTGMQQISVNIQEATDSTVETLKKAEEGNQLLNLASNQMNMIDHGVKATRDQMVELEEKSKAIEEIIGIITGIAKQTNLLALNAAIEAARSGEHGKGFAVVAEEVKNLAEGSTKAVEQIAAIIEEVLREIHIVTDYMEKSNKAADEGIRVIDETKESFTHIFEAVQRAARQMEEISAATEEITAGTEELTAGSQDSSIIVSKFATKVEQVSGLTETQNHSMEQVSNAVQELNELNRSLQVIVKSYN
ncbi:methyl-accepting chemotaxis protein [Lachnospiraceae bacterium KM106-2]|nr:methyl-accepting chemotaxis protein [Lachnospiraceae bacterium KM106-2]